ncbi:MAG: hypothetical protein NVS3B19_19270 [Ginsengibacter sp.]
MFVGLLTEAYAQYDMSQFKIFFKGQEIKMSQLDSLKKLYPKVRFRSDKTKTPPELFIDPYTDEDSLKTYERLDSASKYWEGRAVPLFSAKDINGRNFSASSLKGKVIVMNFYFIHCAPCLQEMPSLNDIVKDKEGSGIVFLAFALDKKDDLLPFLKLHPFGYNQVADGQNVTDQFKIATWPTNIVIDKNGIIKYFRQGASEKVIGEIRGMTGELLK